MDKLALEVAMQQWDDVPETEKTRLVAEREAEAREAAEAAG